MNTSAMTTAADFNPYAALNGHKGSKAIADKHDPNGAQAIQDRFLKLLTTQLLAQDPLNPMDNSQMTSQMAQISQVGGIENVNQGIQTLVTSQKQSQSLLAANMVGRHALTRGQQLSLESQGGQATGAIKLPTQADELIVTILDKQGQRLDTLQVKNAQEGMNFFSWDGKNSRGEPLAAGSYRFHVQAMKTGPNGSIKLAAEPYAQQKIVGVSFEQNGATHFVLNDGRRVKMDAIEQFA